MQRQDQIVEARKLLDHLANRTTALADGILRTAQQNASQTLTSLLQGLGFEKIDFN